MLVVLPVGMHLGLRRHISHIALVRFVAYVNGPTVPALIGDILILLKKQLGVWFAFASVLFVIAVYVCDLWESSNRVDTLTHFWLFWIMIDRVGWLIPYSLVIQMTAKKFALSKEKHLSNA